MAKLVLIDGHSILNRAFYGVPELTNREGLHTNAIFGFLNIMFKILEEEKPDYLTVAFDVKHPTFRHQLFKEYKGTRKPMPAELHEQVPVLKELLRAMNIQIMELPGYEADDLLGTMASKAFEEGNQVSIISGDRDLLQLATDNVMIRIPKTKAGGTEIENYYAADVIEKYHVTPSEFIDLKALMGDASDNIPGVAGIGEKMATAVISKYHSIENAYENIDFIEPKRAGKLLAADYDSAVLSKRLATINTAAPVLQSYKDGKLDSMYTDEALKIINRLEFKKFTERFKNNGAAAEKSKLLSVDEICTIVRFEDLDIESMKNGGNISIFGFKRGGAKEPIQMTFDFLQSERECDEHNRNCYCVAIAWRDNDRDRIVFVEMNSSDEQRLFEAIRNNNISISLFELKRHLKEFPSLEIMEGKIEVLDTGIIAYLINPIRGNYGFEEIAADYLGWDIDVCKELKGKESYSSLYENCKESVVKLLSYWAYIAHKTRDDMKKKLKDMELEDLYNNIELPLIYSLFRMEREGILVNARALKDYGNRLKESISVLEKDIFVEIGEEFNINSPKQLGEILFGKMGLPGGKKTKTGYSTSADVLEKLSGEYPVVSKILEYRQLTKLKSTYADGLAEYITDDGRIHGTFNQTITATGRISSTEPNLQNIPIRMAVGKELRKVFIPKEGCVFIDADYSQIELRVLAHMSSDEALIESYNSKEDIHKITASKVFNTPFDQVTELQRRNAKAVNFGIVYGISSFGLSQDLSISRKEADEYIKQYFETYPGIKIFLDETVDKAKKNGYVRTLYNRIRPIPELSSSNFMQRSFGERIAMNSPIQGTAADIIKIAMIEVDRRLIEGGYKSKIVLQVHDELLLEVYEDELSDVSTIVKESMSGAANLKVKLEIGMGTGVNWLDAH